MSFVGALALSVFTAVAAFFAVSTALDNDFLDLNLASIFNGRAGETRMEAFAMPGLASSANLATALRPLPALADAGPSTGRKVRASILSTQQPETVRSTGDRGVLVAPLMRQAPAEPILASDETTKPVPKAPKTAIIAGKSPPSPSRPSEPLEAATRSALGGPKPISTGQSKAAPVRRNTSAPAAR
ncbi:MAG: hypothetical protein AB7E81_10965 [Hyphomicrobiaceae bacterium]